MLTLNNPQNGELKGREKIILIFRSWIIHKQEGYFGSGLFAMERGNHFAFVRKWKQTGYVQIQGL